MVTKNCVYECHWTKPSNWCWFGSWVWLSVLFLVPAPHYLHTFYIHHSNYVMRNIPAGVHTDRVIRIRIITFPPNLSKLYKLLLLIMFFTWYLNQSIVLFQMCVFLWKWFSFIQKIMFPINCFCLEFWQYKWLFPYNESCKKFRRLKI